MQDFLNTKNCINCEHKSVCFNTLLQEELQFINENKIQIQFFSGENLCKQGAFATYVMFVTSGMVKLYVEGGGQKRLAVKLLKEGDFIGLSSLWGSKIYQYSAQALKTTEVCMIEQTDIKSLLEKNISFSNELLKTVSADESQLFAKLRTSALKQTHGKMASTLLYLGGKNFAKDSPFQYLHRKNIADFAGISLEGSIKILKEFEDEGIIKINKKSIEIVDKERLIQIERYG
ncbi:MAG: Crp/Fnr family transcriptional regulator [Bacteroidota bacterium]|nr:Crp/Fnr family transcriptional regulator [Bacteroidota bacterium]